MSTETKLMVFDLDGTLVDTAADLVAALDVALSGRGYPRSDFELARRWIGHGARHMIRNALEFHEIAFDESLIEAMFRDFLAYYQDNISRHSRPFPAVLEALDDLSAHGWTFAVCSNKHERMCRLLLDELGMSERFRAIAGGDTYGVSKPDPGHLLGTIADAAGHRDRTIMVGDAATDVDAARAASIPVVGVTFGYTSIPMRDLAPDILLESFADLTPEVADKLLGRRI